MVMGYMIDITSEVSTDVVYLTAPGVRCGVVGHRADNLKLHEGVMLFMKV